MDSTGNRGNYAQFFLMILTSVIVMYILSYTNSWEVFDHAWFSETRVFMVLMMGGSMAIIMLTFMRSMYQNKRLNAAIYIGSLIVMMLALVFVRSQTTIGDVYYMKGMIPHHSIAVLTSSRARIDDARVRKLADGIIRSQQKEIKEMSWLINDIGVNGIAATPDEAEQRRVPDFSNSGQE